MISCVPVCLRAFFVSVFAWLEYEYMYISLEHDLNARLYFPCLVSVFQSVTQWWCRCCLFSPRAFDVLCIVAVCVFL